MITFSYLEGVCVTPVEHAIRPHIHSVPMEASDQWQQLGAEATPEASQLTQVLPGDHTALGQYNGLYVYCNPHNTSFEFLIIRIEANGSCT